MGASLSLEKYELSNFKFWDRHQSWEKLGSIEISCVLGAPVDVLRACVDKLERKLHWGMVMRG